MMDINLFSNLPQIYNALREYYLDSASVIYSSGAIELFSKNIIIIEPFIIDNKYFTISPIWKRYLAVHSPNNKLIVMGFLDYQSRNYIDLLNLPKDFNAYVENALPVSEDLEIPIDGADMREYLKHFFEGHGNQSLISKLNQLQTTFNSAETLVKTGDATFEEVQNELLIPYGKGEWDELINRWQNYYPYFEYLPFYPTMQEIDQIFKEISEFFICKENKSTLFLNLNVAKNLKKVIRYLL